MRWSEEFWLSQGNSGVFVNCDDEEKSAAASESDIFHRTRSRFGEFVADVL